MFIIKLGAEALNKLEEQLTVNCNQSLGIQKSVNGNNQYSCEAKLETSILYNLLSSDDGSSLKPQSLLFPNNFRPDLHNTIPPRANTISYSNSKCYDLLSIVPRPYSAPHFPTETFSQRNLKRKQSNDNLSDFDEIKSMSFNKNCKISSKSSIDSQPMSCSTDSSSNEPMDLSTTNDNLCKSTESYDGKFIVDSWLFKIVSLINTTNKQFNSNLTELPLGIRLHLLRSSWHRIIITYLFEHLMKMPSSVSIELQSFLKSVAGITNQSFSSKKKMSSIYKSLADELNVILYQIKKLNLDDVSMNFLRVGLLFTGNHDENNQKNLKLIELFIQSKIDNSESNLQIVSDLVDNLLRLNSVIIETTFYSHLRDSVENTIDHLFTNS